MSPSATPRADDVRIGEAEVTRLGAYKVALAKCFVDTRPGATVPVAWLSVVEKGSDAGAKDLELAAGDTLPLGPDTYAVVEVTLPGPDAGGSILLRKQ